MSTQARVQVEPARLHERVLRELVRLRWPIPLALGLLALALAVVGRPRALVGAPLVWVVLAIAGLSAALYAARSFVARRLPELSAQGLGLFRIAWALALLHVLPFLRDSVHQAPFPRSDQLTEDVVNVGPAHWLAAHPNVTGPIGQIVFIALILFAFGVFARLAYLVAALGFAALALAAAMAQSLHDWGLPVVVILCLVGVPWGDGLGVDDTIRRLRGKPAPHRKSVYSLAIWLPGLVLGSAWFAASYAKLSHSGFAWISGGAVRYHFVSDAHRAKSDWGLWIASHPHAAVAASAGGVLFEATFILGILFRSPWIRLAFAAGAVSFFAGLYWFQGIQWEAWWIVLVALLPWQPLAAGIRRLLPRHTVLIDGACPRCRRTARILHGLDWFDRLTFADATDDDERQRHAPSVGKEEALNRMVAVDRRGVARYGFDAYRSLSLSVPLLAPLGLLAGLPWIRGRAERLYDAAASSRHRCSDETCTPGALPGRQRSLVSRAATLGALPCLLIVGVLVTQTIVSDRHLERQPFLSNYPMYSDTYASPAAYDAAHANFRDFRFFRYRSNTRLSLLVSQQNEVFPMDESDVIPLVTVARRHALVRVVTKRRNDDEIKPKLRAEVARVTVGARTVSGEPASGELLVTANQYGFDWKRGRIGVRHANVPLGILDLRTLKLVSPV